MGNKLSMTHVSLNASCDSDTKLNQSAMKMEYCPIAAEAGDPRDWLPTEVTMSKLDLLLPSSEESPPGDNVQVEQAGSSTKLSLPMTPFSFKRSRGQHPDGPLCLLPPTLIPHSTASSTTPTRRPLSKMAHGDPYSLSRSTRSSSKQVLPPWYPQVKTSAAKTNLSRKRTRSLSSAATELIKRSKESIMGRAFRRNPASDTLVPKLLSPVLEPLPAAGPIMTEAKGARSDKGKSRKKDDKKREASSSSYTYDYSSSTTSSSSSSSGSGSSSTSPTSYSYSSSTKKSSYDTSTSSTTKSSSSPSSKSKESKKPPSPVAKKTPPVPKPPPPSVKTPPSPAKKPPPLAKKPPPQAKKPPPPSSSTTTEPTTTTSTSYKSPTATSSTKPSDKTKTTSSYSNSVSSSESPAPQKPVSKPKPKIYSAYGSPGGTGTRKGPPNRKIPPPPVFIGNYGGSSSGIKKTKTPADRLQNVDIVEELCYSCPGDPCSSSCTCACDYYSCCNDCGQYTLVPCCSCTPDKSPVKYCRRQRFNFDDGKEKGDPCDGPPFRCPCPTNPYDCIPVGKNPTAEAVACAIKTSKGCDPSDCGEVLPSESGTYFYDANRRCFVPVVEVKGPETPKKEIVDEIIEDEPILTNIEPIIQPVLDENCCGGGCGGPFGPIQPSCCGTLGGSFMPSGLPGCAPTGGLGPKCSDNMGMKALGGMNMPGLANMGPYGSIAVPQFNYVPPPPPPGAPNCPCPPCCPQGPCAPHPPCQPCINGPICFPGYPFPMCPPGMGGNGKKKKNKKGKKGKGYANTASGQSKAYDDQATYDYGTAPTPDYSGSGSGYSGTLLSYE